MLRIPSLWHRGGRVLVMVVVVVTLLFSSLPFAHANVATTTTIAAATIASGLNEKQFDSDIALVKARAQVTWLQTVPGAYFSDKIEIRRVNPSDRTSPVGVFARADVNAEELLIAIPKAATIEGIPTALDSDTAAYWFECDTAHKLSQEIRLGSNSTYSGFVEYLLEQSPAQIPSGWSRAGQELLLQVLDQDENGDGPLPPLDAVHWMKEWSEACGGDGMEDDPLEKFAALMLIQRGWETKLVPIYDMINHHGGNRWVNIHDPRINHVDDVQVRSNRRMQAGEELLYSYTDYADPKYFHEKHGTPEVFRDFGFVESYPRRFYFQEGSLYFEIDYNEKKNSNPSSQTTTTTAVASDDGLLELTWLEQPRLRGFNFAVKEYSRLQALSGTLQNALLAADVPHHELDMIHQYYQALMVALQMAAQSIDMASDKSTTSNSRGAGNGYMQVEVEVPVA
jgi:SET domain